LLAQGGRLALGLGFAETIHENPERNQAQQSACRHLMQILNRIEAQDPVPQAITCKNGKSAASGGGAGAAALERGRPEAGRRIQKRIPRSRVPEAALSGNAKLVETTYVLGPEISEAPCFQFLTTSACGK
jgi:hypothetical protein